MNPIHMFLSALALSFVLAGCRPNSTFLPVAPTATPPPTSTPAPGAGMEFNVAAIDDGDFSSYLDASKLDINQLRPGKAYVYWEWIDATPVMSHTLAYGGQAERTELSPTVVAALEHFAKWDDLGDGLGPSCEPGVCWEYVAFVEGDEVRPVVTLRGVKEFLGEIDSPEDVVLLIGAWGDDSGGMAWAVAKAIKPDDNGYMVLLTSSTTMYYNQECDPFAIDTYCELVHVARTGKVDVLARKFLERECRMFLD